MTPSTAAPPALTVVIVVFDTEPDLLLRATGSVREAADAAHLSYEIVVADNGSRSVLPPPMDDEAARVVRLPDNVGFGAAANHAVSLARADVVLLLNPDAAVGPGALVELLALVGAPEGAAGLFCGWLRSDSGVQVDAYRTWLFSVQRQATRRRWADRLHAAERAGVRTVPVDKVCGGALFARTAVLRALGPFDEDFFLYGEDADLSARAAARGLGLWACPRVEVRHERASSMKRHSALVERARTDAALRLAARQRSRPVGLAVRLELVLVTLAGLVVGGRSSTSARTRLARLRELWRWGLARRVPRFQP